MSHLPAVSVVIPTRNRWRLLARAALRSALAQEFVPVEVIVVHEGSTEPIPNRLGNDDPRLRVVRLPEHRGVAAACNAGIAAAAEGVALDRAAFAHWVAWGHLRRRRRLRAAGVYLRSGLKNRRRGDLYLAAAFAARAALPVVRLARAWPRGGSSSVPPPPGQPDWLGVQR